MVVKKLMSSHGINCNDMKVKLGSCLKQVSNRVDGTLDEISWLFRQVEKFT